MTTQLSLVGDATIHSAQITSNHNIERMTQIGAQVIAGIILTHSVVPVHNTR